MTLHLFTENNLTQFKQISPLLHEEDSIFLLSSGILLLTELIDTHYLHIGCIDTDVKDFNIDIVSSNHTIYTWSEAVQIIIQQHQVIHTWF